MINSEASPRQVQQALERLAAGDEKTSAVGLHPAADQVERLVDLATTVQKLTRESPPAHSAAVLRERFLVDGSGRRASWVHTRPLNYKITRHPAPRHDFRWFSVVVLGAFLALIAGTSLSLAAMISGPDSPLYPIRLSGERALIAVTRDQVSKADLKIDLADQRFRDAEDMAEKKRGSLAVQALTAYYGDLRDASDTLDAAGPRDARWTGVRDHFSRSESKDLAGLEHQLALNHDLTDAARVAALQDRYAKERPDIDKRLGIVASSATPTIPVLGANQPSPSPTP